MVPWVRPYPAPPCGRPVPIFLFDSELSSSIFCPPTGGRASPPSTTRAQGKNRASPSGRTPHRPRVERVPPHTWGQTLDLLVLHRRGQSPPPAADTEVPTMNRSDARKTVFVLGRTRPSPFGLVRRPFFCESSKVGNHGPDRPCPVPLPTPVRPPFFPVALVSFTSPPLARRAPRRARPRRDHRGGPAGKPS